MQGNVIILGAGISGLSLAYYLRKYMPHLEITILEKNETPGGVIQRVRKDDCTFDSGPKTFKTSRCNELLTLSRELKLDHDILYSSKESEIRYIYHHKKLKKLPSSLASFFTSSIGRGMIPSLLKEPFLQKGLQEEETIGSFFRRRFGNFIADTLIEPFILGICAGDMHKLSINAYFPELKRLESEHGSILKAMLKRKKSTGKKDPSLFNIKEGLYTLIETLSSFFEKNILYNKEVKEIKNVGSKIEVITQEETYLADHIFFALPLSSLKQIKTPFEKEKEVFLHDFSSSSIASIHLGFKRKVLLQKGFGYLVPSKEKDDLLGVLFDTQIFPNLFSCPYQDRLTVLMGGTHNQQMMKLSDEELFNTAFEGLYQHLGFHENPDAKLVIRYNEVIPQYPLFHAQKVQRFTSFLEQSHKNVTFVGNYLKGAAVNACVNTSFEAAKKFAQIV